MSTEWSYLNLTLGKAKPDYIQVAMQDLTSIFSLQTVTAFINADL